MVKYSLVIPYVTQLWMKQRTEDMIQPQKKIRNITDRLQQVPQMIPNISRQSSTNYKQQYKSSFILLFVELLPISNSTQRTPMRFSELPFLVLQEASQKIRGNQEASQKIRGNQDIDMKWQVKTHSGAQRISQLCYAYPKTTK